MTASIRVARDLSNDLVVDDHDVSRKHAPIDCLSGTCYLTNLSSTGSTCLDGQQVISPVVLPPNSWIQIQGYSYLFDGSRLLTEQGEVAAAFSSPALSSGRAISFAGVLSAPFKGLDSIRWLFGSILAIIPIVGLFANGYRYRLSRKHFFDFFDLYWP